MFSEGKAGIADVAADDPGLFMFMMIIAFGVIVAILFVMVCAVVIAMLLLFLSAVGILSLSVFMGWYKKSLYTGVQWFVFLSFGVTGMAGVLMVALLVTRFGHSDYSLNTLLSWGIPSGLAGGLLAGWLVLFAGRLIYRRFFGQGQIS